MKRNLRIDYLKAVAIIMVVLHHCIAYYGSSVTPLNKFGELVIVLLQTVHVPLFCMIAGYLCHEQPVGQFYTKKIKKILVPFITFTVFKLIYSMFVSHEFSHGGETVLEQLKFSFLVGTQYWFVYTILGMFLVAPLFWNRGEKKISRGLIAFILSYTVVLVITVFDLDIPDWFQLRHFLLYLPYFAFGCVLSQEKDFITKKITKGRDTLLLIITLSVVVLYAVGYYYVPSVRIHPVRIIVAITGSYVLYRIVSRLPNENKIASCIARYSLQIMFFDSIYRIILFSLIGRVIPVSPVIAIILAVPTIILGIISCIIIEKIPGIRLFFGL